MASTGGPTDGGSGAEPADDLQHAQGPWKGIVDAMPQLVWMADDDGRVSYYNAQAERYSGIRRTPDGSWRWDPVVHPDDLLATEQAWDDAVATGVPYECEHRLLMADGSERWHLSRALPIQKGTAEGAVWFGTATDIHDHRTAQEALTEHEARFRTAFQAAGVGMVIVGLDGTVLDVNHTVPASLRWTRDELLGRNVSDLSAAWSSGEHDSIGALLAGTAASYSVEDRHELDDGRSMVIERTVSLARDRDGAPEHFVVLLNDITERRAAEAALVASRQFLRRVLDNLFAFVGVLTPDGTLVEANRAPLDAAHLEAEEVLGRPFWETYWWSYAPEAQERIRDAVRRAATGEFVRFDALVRLAGGELSWIDLQLAPLVDDTGQITHVIPSGIDVSERRSKSEALTESESRLRAVFHSIDQGYCLCEIVLDEAGEPVDYRFLEVNRLFEERTGLADPVGRTAREMVPDLEAQWVKTYAGVALGGAPVRFQQASAAMGRHFDVFVTPVEPRGRFAIVFDDITDRMTAEAALRESEQRFRTMANHAPVMVWITEPDGACSFLSESWYEFTGQRPEDALGFGWLAATHPDDAEAAGRTFAEANERRAPFRLEYRLRRHDGTYRWAIDSAAPRIDETGTFLGYIGSVIDITERKEAEQALAEQHRDEKRARRQAELLSELVGDIESVSELADKAQRIVQFVVPLLADAGLVAFLDAGRDVAAAHAADGPTEERLLQLWQANGATALTESVVTAAVGAHSSAVLPLDVGAGKAVLVLSVVDPGRAPYDDEDRRFFADLASRISVVLRTAVLHEAEHVVAMRLQRALLPGTPAGREDIELATRYVPASSSLEVGGDWYETFTLADGRLGVVVGDVVGHNIEAAAAMGQLRAGFLALATRSDQPDELLSSLDEFAGTHRITDFATAVCATLDPLTGVLHYASAGHPPLLVVEGDGSFRWLDLATSAPLGLLDVRRRPRATETLAPGSLLVACSDGLIERRTSSLDDGMARLVEAALRVRSAPIEEAADSIIEEMRAAAGFGDDVVLVCLRIPPASPKHFRLVTPADTATLVGLRSSLRSWMESRGAPARPLEDALLAISEACTNAVLHAYHDQEPGVVHLAATHLETGELEVRVSDLGVWRPRRSPSPGGRGTTIMQALSTSFAIHTGPAGTTIEMTLPLT